MKCISPLSKESYIGLSLSNQLESTKPVSATVCFIVLCFELSFFASPHFALIQCVHWHVIHVYPDIYVHWLTVIWPRAISPLRAIQNFHKTQLTATKAFVHVPQSKMNFHNLNLRHTTKMFCSRCDIKQISKINFNRIKTLRCVIFCRIPTEFFTQRPKSTWLRVTPTHVQTIHVLDFTFD